MALSFKEKTALQKTINEQKKILSGTPTPAQKADAQKKLNDAMTALGIPIPSKYGAFENGGYYAGDVIEKGVTYKLILAPKETEFLSAYASSNMQKSTGAAGNGKLNKDNMTWFLKASINVTPVSKADIASAAAIKGLLDSLKAQATKTGTAATVTSIRDVNSSGLEIMTTMQMKSIWPSCNADFPAATSITQRLNAANYNGFSDWFLPSLYEMNVIYYNLKPSTDTTDLAAAWSSIDTNTIRKQITKSSTPTFPNQTKVPLFQTGVETSEADLNAGKPPNQSLSVETAYWTATLGPTRNDYAFTKICTDGKEDQTYVTTQLLVRAIRRVAA